MENPDTPCHDWVFIIFAFAKRGEEAVDKKAEKYTDFVSDRVTAYQKNVF